MRLRHVGWFGLLSIAWATPAHAGKTKVQHANVVAPTWAVDRVDTGVGTVTHMKRHGDSLVVAGQTGVAMVSASGAVTWKVELPEAMVRSVAVDDAGIAWTAWSLADVQDKGKALNAWAAGKLLDKFVVEGASVGAIGLDGTAAWSVPAIDQRPLSPPGLSSGTVGIMTGEHIATYQRADGAQAGNTELKSGYKAFPGLSGVLDHGTRGEVVEIEGNFFTSFFSLFYKASPTGALIEKEAMAGLTPYVDITCGPVLVGDTIVFGTTGDADFPSMFVGMKTNMKNKWKTASPDTQSGCGDITVVDGTIYASSNFCVMALNEKGKDAWVSVNKKGGLYPSANRGIRYISNFGARKSYGDLMTVGAGKVFVGSSLADQDVITVLDAATGKYDRTIELKQTIVSMAVVGDTLAVATEGGLGLLSL